MRRRENEPEKENNERWLLTYSDLITLLMVFFVIMYSMSTVNAQKFQALAQALNKAFTGGQSILQNGGQASKPSITQPTAPPPSTTKSSSRETNMNSLQEDTTLQNIKNQLDKFAQENGLQTTMGSSIEERGLVISIEDTLLFQSGSANITPEARNLLSKIGSVLDKNPNFIRVEGNTDNLPIDTPQYPSNWELSTDRATNVVHILAQQISPEKLSAIGYGQYRPIASNATAEGRAKNRRVDLVVLRSSLNDSEP